MRRNNRGFTLLEVTIAAVLLAVLAMGALATLRASVGFTTQAGRFTEGMARTMELTEGLRNEVHVDDRLDDDAWDTDDSVTLTNLPATRTRTVEANPHGAAPGTMESMMKRVRVRYEWTEAR